MEAQKIGSSFGVPSFPEVYAPAIFYFPHSRKLYFSRSSFRSQRFPGSTGRRRVASEVCLAANRSAREKKTCQFCESVVFHMACMGGAGGEKREAGSALLSSRHEAILPGLISARVGNSTAGPSTARLLRGASVGMTSLWVIRSGFTATTSQLQ